MNYVDKIDKNAKAIKTIIGLLIIIVSLVYGFCIFIYQNKQCTKDVDKIKLDLIRIEQDSLKKHKEIDERINQNEKNFQMTSAKLDVSLIEIRSDLKFIKEHLIRKGLDK